MKTEVKRLDATKREMAVEVSEEVVKNKFEDVFKKISQEAKVPGFRPGHVPRDILEKKFSDLAHEQVLKELIPDIYDEALEKEKLEVLELPRIKDVKLTRNTLSFKAEVEVRPEIPLKNYKGIKINYQKVSVAPDEIKRQLDSLKESRKIDKLDDRFAKGLGYPSINELEHALERQIYLQKEDLERQKIENQIIENITKGVEFKLPAALVDKQLNDLLRQDKLALALKGVPREKIQEQEKILAQELEPQAKKQVQIYLILAEVAKKENIAQDEHMAGKAMEFLLREADWQEAA